jgi:hypothetical protein
MGEALKEWVEQFRQGQPHLANHLFNNAACFANVPRKDFYMPVFFSTELCFNNSSKI